MSQDPIQFTKQRPVDQGVPPDLSHYASPEKMKSLLEEQNKQPAGIFYFGLVEQIVNQSQNLSDEEIEKQIKKQFKMRTIPIKLLNSLIKMAQRKHKIPKSSSFYTVFFQKFEVDQTLK